MPKPWSVAVAAFALALAGCGGGGGSNGAASAGPAAADTGGPEDPDGSSVCTDPVSDVAESVDLSSVSLRRSGDELVATFTTAHALPDKGTALWSITATGRHFDPLIQLAAKTVDGKQAALYNLSEDDFKHEDLPGLIAMTDTTMTAKFPMRLIAGLAAGETWHGVLSMNGNEADVCPNGKGITFPAPWLQTGQPSPSVGR